jgi:hypothetical protein
MQRFSWRGRNAPPEQDTRQTGLSEAKLDAWAKAAGERRPSNWPPAPPRRHHPGLLDDLPLPDGPIRPRRGAFQPVFRALLRAVGMRRAESGSSPPASASGARGDGLARFGAGQAGAPGAAACAAADIVPRAA